MSSVTERVEVGQITTGKLKGYVDCAGGIGLEGTRKAPDRVTTETPV